MYEQITPKLLSWASILDDKTREQAIQTSEMPFVTPHMSLMPDAHFGLGSTVGSVVPTVGYVMPACVGVDIGCGMIAVRTQFTYADVLRRTDIAGSEFPLSYLRVAIEQAVPLGFNYN